MKLRHSAMLVVCLLGIAVAAMFVRWHLDPPAPRPTARPAVVADRTATQAVAMLRAWDVRRAEAWRRGDGRALAGLYTDGSRSGAHDSAALRAYVDRGLRVGGMQMQVLAVSLRVWTADRILVEVTDRLTGAVAVGHGVRIELPQDNPSTRLVWLQRVSGEWLVDEVRDQPSAAARTASTSRSRNW